MAQYKAKRVGTVVSRRLRDAGWNISPSARRNHHRGVFVSAQDDQVSVLVDTGLEARNRRTADRIAAEMGVWAEASEIDVRVSEDGSVFIYADYDRS